MNLLTHTSPKSRCPSISLPAGLCCPARDLSVASARSRGRQAICEQCYARKGHYCFACVRNNQALRVKWWFGTDPPDRALILADAVRREGTPKYFRAFDAGDLPDLTAIPTWLRFADLLPEVTVWIPTRTWLLPKFLPGLRELNSHPRIVVRPSACAFDDLPPVVQGLSGGHASHWKEEVKADWLCPGDCAGCRTCWERPELSVSFRKR